MKLMHVERLLNSQVRPLQLFISCWRASHCASVVTGSLSHRKIPITSLTKCQQCGSLGLCLERNSCSCVPQWTVAYGEAGGVPIAIPFSW